MSADRTEIAITDRAIWIAVCISQFGDRSADRSISGENDATDRGFEIARFLAISAPRPPDRAISALDLRLKTTTLAFC